MNSYLLRCVDFFLSLFGLLVASPALLVLFIIGLFDTGSPLFVQERVGRGRQPFRLYKFRTMALSTENVATHLVSASAITRFGSFLRKSKLDELPQLWNVLKGDMSFVGPRPCLHSQKELIGERELRGVYAVRPGITGLAQVNDIDMSTPQLLAEWDERLIKEFNLKLYFKLLMQTIMGGGSGDRVDVSRK